MNAQEVNWPDRKFDEYNIAFVRRLLAIGEVVEFTDPDCDSYDNFPCGYFVTGVKIEYLPHLNYCVIENRNVRLPMTPEELTEAIKMAKTTEEPED